MSLHGDVRVNGEQIVWWSAHRKSGAPAVVAEYAVDLAWFEDHEWQHRHFTILHRPKEGAVSLTAKVMVRAEQMLSVRRPTAVHGV
jgi:hypothetical protein